MNLEKERKYIKAEVSKEIDRYSKGAPITCGMGCSNCCHVKVGVFKEEVDDIMSLGMDIDMEKLETQVKDWNNSDKNCIFLKDNNCSIQDNKPLSCISHLSNSPASLCAIDSTKAPHMIRSKSVVERLKSLREDNKMLILHEEIYRRLS